MGLISYGLDPERRHRTEPNHRFHYDEADDRVIIETISDVEPTLKQNKEQKNRHDGYDSERDRRCVARIDITVWEKVLREEGWDMADQNNMERLLQWIDDSDHAGFATTYGKHARRPRRNFYRASTASVKKIYAGD